MKSLITILIIVGLFAGLKSSAAEPSASLPTNPPSSTAPTLNQTAPEQPAAALAQPAAAPSTNRDLVATNAVVPPITSENGPNGLRMNFHGAPLNLVLNYLVEAAGFIVNKTVPDIRGSVEISSKEPVTKEEAVALLSSVLKQNGYAMIRNGRILTILALDNVKTADLDITTPYNPEDIASSDEVITAIIHVRYASAQQLMANLEILLPTSTTISVNESANSLIMVATKTDIKRMLRIINALDTSIASVSSIKVRPLQYADAKDTATLITQLFAPPTSNQGGFGGGGRGALFNMIAGGFGRGGRGGGGAPGGGGTGSTGAQAARVTAVADDRSNSVVVSAPEDLMATIMKTLDEIDQPVTDVTEIRVFRLKNADPVETADELSQLFPDPSTSPGGNQNNMPFFFRGRGGFGNTTPASTTSDRMKKIGTVRAVPDARTATLVVTASKTLMPEIEEMIHELDSKPGQREVVGFYELQNADAQDVQQILQSMFNRSNVRMNNNSANTVPLLGPNSPLNQRINQTMPTIYNNNTIGNTGAGRGGAGGLP